MDAAKLVLIGAGRHASLNIYPYLHFLGKTAKVVANCDLNQARAEANALRFGIPKSYCNFREMLEIEKPDGAIICGGDRMHGEVARAVMEAGVHAYVEKPHAPDLEASREMLRVSIQTARICMSAYKKRFAPAYRKAREAVRSAAFGQPRFLSLIRTMGGGRAGEDAGYVWQWGSHGTDLISFLFGPVREIQALKADGDWRALTANLLFANGAAGNLSICTPGGSWEEALLLGDNRRAVKVLNSVEMTVFDGEKPCDGHWPSWIHGYTQSSIEMGYVGELREFVAAISELRQPESNIAQSSHTAALHEAFLLAVETGEVVPVEQFDPGDLPAPKPAWS